MYDRDLFVSDGALKDSVPKDTTGDGVGKMRFKRFISCAMVHNKYNFCARKNFVQHSSVKHDSATTDLLLSDGSLVGEQLIYN